MTTRPPPRSIATESRSKSRGASRTDKGEGSGSKALLEAFSRDLGPAAEELKKLLADLDAGKDVKEAAAALAEKLPSMMPGDPAMADVLAEAMAEEFGEEDTEGAEAGRAGAPRTPLANKITNPFPKCHRQMSADGHCTHCEKLDANRKLVNGLVADLDKKGPGGKTKGWKDRTENLGELEQKTFDDIKKANPNMRVESSVATINTEQLQHSMNHHGNPETEAKRNQIAITHEDLKRIPEVLADYDSIESGKGAAEGKKQEAVVFKKKYPDGTIACVELDVYSDKMKKRVLKFQTMWKEKE